MVVPQSVGSEVQQIPVCVRVYLYAVAPRVWPYVSDLDGFGLQQHFEHLFSINPPHVLHMDPLSGPVPPLN